MAELAKDLTTATEALGSALGSYIDACSAIQEYCKHNPPSQVPDTLANCIIQECGAFEVHERQLRTAKAMVNQARNYSLPKVTINSLPSEILVRIFHLVVGHRPCGVEKRSGEKIRFPKYPDYLSHVCSGWRDLALKTPTLWTHIDHVPYHSLSLAFDERAYELAERAEFLPLHFHLYQPAFLQGYDYQNLLEFLTETSFAIQSFELVLSETSGEFSTEYVEILETHLQNCVPKLFNELTIINPAATAPTLLHPASNVEDVDEGLWLSVDDVFEQTLPLKILRLDGVYFRWEHPIYQNLVKLYLTSSHKPGVIITKLQLSAILKSNPVLQVLHFGLEIWESTQSTTEAVVTVPALLPELQVLNLTSTEQDRLCTFISVLVPSPRALQFSIELHSRSLPPYDDEVLKFVSGSNITKLQVIARDLGYQRNITPVDEILHPVPHVQELVLDGFNWPMECNSTLGPCECSAGWDGTRLKVLYILNGTTSMDTIQMLAMQHTAKKIVFWRCWIWSLDHKRLLSTEIKSALSHICGDVCVAEGDRNPVEHWDW